MNAEHSQNIHERIMQIGARREALLERIAHRLLCCPDDELGPKVRLCMKRVEDALLHCAEQQPESHLHFYLDLAEIDLGLIEDLLGESKV